MALAPVLLVALGVTLLFLKRSGQISIEQARQYLNSGALVVEVRSPGEFTSGHLSQAKNIPLDEIESKIRLLAPDKDQPILLHCQSGVRSAMAAKRLRVIGFTKAFNLGSFARASQTLSDRI